MDIVIKDLHLNVHMHGMDDVSVEKILTQINKLSIQMAKTKEELKAEFAAGFTEISDSIANVAADIDRLVENTNPTGGLTEEEVEEQLSQLRGISTALKSVADKTPEPPVE